MKMEMWSPAWILHVISEPDSDQIHSRFTESTRVLESTLNPLKPHFESGVARTHQNQSFSFNDQIAESTNPLRIHTESNCRIVLLPAAHNSDRPLTMLTLVPSQ
jgi:hypothetical protein